FPWDVSFGILKAFVFGFVSASVSCFKGYYASVGADGVGNSTTRATVLSCIYVLLADFVLAGVFLYFCFNFMIELGNFKKSFGSNLVWKDVSFSIEDGETIAIIGRSGCGKSVLMKHLNALMYPDSGDVIIDGKNIFELEYVELRKMRQRFGVLFQGSALF